MIEVDTTEELGYATKAQTRRNEREKANAVNQRDQDAKGQQLGKVMTEGKEQFRENTGKPTQAGKVEPIVVVFSSVPNNPYPSQLDKVLLNDLGAIHTSKNNLFIELPDSEFDTGVKRMNELLETGNLVYFLKTGPVVQVLPQNVHVVDEQALKSVLKIDSGAPSTGFEAPDDADLAGDE